MAKHRSLSNALLTSEKMGFIKGQADHSEPNPASQPVVQTDAVIVPVVELASDTSAKPEVQREKKSAGNRPPSTNVEAKSATPSNDDYLVAITTRLQARTADALRRAHLEQKLNRCEPATQQEIIELAVQQWLRNHSFLD